MSLVPWRRRLDRIDEVVVPESVLDGDDDPANLRMYLAMFVDHALGTAMYRREELPREAVIAATLGAYLNAGGHAEFVKNVCWCAEHRADMREGLAILGLDEAARIFKDLEVFAVLEPERFARTYGNGADIEIDPYFYELDARTAAIFGSIDDALRAWVLSRPWLRTMPDEEYGRTRAWETPHHRLREERLEERRRANARSFRRGMLALQAHMHVRRATGWRRLLWRIRAAWYSDR